MVKRSKQPKQALVKAAEAAPPLDYTALVTVIGQAHQTAERRAAQAVNVALTSRNWGSRLLAGGSFR